MPQQETKLGENPDITSIVQKSGSSFYWAMRLMPLQKRNAMFAIYAFCREVDDIADGEDSPDSKRANLKLWRDEIDNLYDGNPSNLITKALAGPIDTYGLAKANFVAVIDGMEMDAVDALRLQDMAELVLYCDRVACAVGRLSNAVFGLSGNQADELAKSLGEALQLTNILRDICEDAERDHVYLPADLLSQHGIIGPTANDIVEHSEMAKVCIELAKRAEDNYQKASSIIDRCDKKLIQPAIIMMKSYHQLLRLLEQRGWERLDVPVKVSKLWKLLLAARILIFGS
jgi:presqualene diphosphate synthase